jgi:N-ethylmaleimide reductase
MEVVEALASVWGGNRVAVRIKPGGTWNHMSDSNPDVLFDYVARQLDRFGLAYLHIIEPRVKGNVLIAEVKERLPRNGYARFLEGELSLRVDSNPTRPRRS